MKIKLLTLLFALLWSTSLWAVPPVGVQRRAVEGFRVSSDCLPPSASKQLDINNVRTIVYNGGDMWWDLVGNPVYEIPKGSKRHSLFAGSLWIGGLDQAGQLRVAAQTYRQSGYDFWPGPLTDSLAETDQATCTLYDVMYKIEKSEIDDFRSQIINGVFKGDAADYPNVFAWPAAGKNKDGVSVEALRPDGSKIFLAPFVDMDGNPLEYNPNNGDYPKIDGDQAIWWVINDKGNVHTETGGNPIGIEIHMMAFAFATANAVNDMTFYRQTVINRSSQTLNECYIGQWVDADLGRYNDDYVGCDTTLGLGYIYNGDPNDDGATGYGLNPPSMGIDFFQGPRADNGDGIDNDKDGVVDEDGETIIMSKFVYYNNDFSLTGNPEVATHYYGYLRGLWKDGTAMVNNGTNGYAASKAGPETDYMFPGDPVAGIGWTEASAGNQAADRRLLQSAGPFTLKAGAINEVVIGAVWAREYANDQFGSITKMKAADKIAQALFDANFRLLEGPRAPRMSAVEMDREIVLTWGYEPTDNNYNESYRQADPVLKTLIKPGSANDSVFEFQGYIIYQLKDATVGANELSDPDRARIVLQCDIIDDVTTIVNRTEQAVGGAAEPIIVDEVMVQGANKGISRSIRISSDLFATGDDSRLSNYTTYYYAAIAYAHNDTSADGRLFVQGNAGFAALPVIPHKTAFTQGGLVEGADYGTELPLIRTQGVGNGGNFVKLAAETEAAIMRPPYNVSTLQYQSGSSPIKVKVTDPTKLKGAYYKVEVVRNRLVGYDTLSASATTVIRDAIYAEWDIYQGTTENGPWSTPVYSSTYRVTEEWNNGSLTKTGSPRPAPLVGNERVVINTSTRENLGFSVAVKDVPRPGPLPPVGGNDSIVVDQNGVIGATISYADPRKAWLSGLADNNEFGGGLWNWINNASGKQTENGAERKTEKSIGLYDPNNNYGTLVGGTVAPFAFTRIFNNQSGPIAPGIRYLASETNFAADWNSIVSLPQLFDVDIVLTPDSSLWSKCVVVETTPNRDIGTGAWPLSAKWRDNIRKDGSVASTKTSTKHGYSWFPGYAINVNTGQRLNIFFGENEFDRQNNGDDMLFNPTDGYGTQLDRVGGRHYIYVTNQPYDGCENAAFSNLMNSNLTEPVTDNAWLHFPNGNHLGHLYKDVAWCMIPMAQEGKALTSPLSIPTETKISLRVYAPFAEATTPSTYVFNTGEVAPQSDVVDTAKSALDLIQVVPNPYYAFSTYETAQLDTRVKITNLPHTCTISILTVNGQLVKQYRKDNDLPYQDWDLRNTLGVPVASGVYIVHVDAGDLGQKTVKMLAIMRRIDLDSY